MENLSSSIIPASSMPEKDTLEPASGGYRAAMQIKTV
jgi:hypothetical protein